MKLSELSDSVLFRLGRRVAEGASPGGHLMMMMMMMMMMIFYKFANHGVLASPAAGAREC